MEIRVLCFNQFLFSITANKAKRDMQTAYAFLAY